MSKHHDTTPHPEQSESMSKAIILHSRCPKSVQTISCTLTIASEMTSDNSESHDAEQHEKPKQEFEISNVDLRCNTDNIISLPHTTIMDTDGHDNEAFLLALGSCHRGSLDDNSKASNFSNFHDRRTSSTSNKISNNVAATFDPVPSIFRIIIDEPYQHIDAAFRWNYNDSGAMRVEEMYLKLMQQEVERFNSFLYLSGIVCILTTFFFCYLSYEVLKLSSSSNISSNDMKKYKRRSSPLFLKNLRKKWKPSTILPKCASAHHQSVTQTSESGSIMPPNAVASSSSEASSSDSNTTFTTQANEDLNHDLSLLMMSGGTLKKGNNNAVDCHEGDSNSNSYSNDDGGDSDHDSCFMVPRKLCFDDCASSCNGNSNTNDEDEEEEEEEVAHHSVSINMVGDDGNDDDKDDSTDPRHHHDGASKAASTSTINILEEDMNGATIYTVVETSSNSNSSSFLFAEDEALCSDYDHCAAQIIRKDNDNDNDNEDDDEFQDVLDDNDNEDDDDEDDTCKEPAPSTPKKGEHFTIRGPEAIYKEAKCKLDISTMPDYYYSHLHAVQDTCTASVIDDNNDKRRSCWIGSRSSAGRKKKEQNWSNNSKAASNGMKRLTAVVKQDKVDVHTATMDDPNHPSSFLDDYYWGE